MASINSLIGILVSLDVVSHVMWLSDGPTALETRMTPYSKTNCSNLYAVPDGDCDHSSPLHHQDETKMLQELIKSDLSHQVWHSTTVAQGVRPIMVSQIGWRQGIIGFGAIGSSNSSPDVTTSNFFSTLVISLSIFTGSDILYSTVWLTGSISGEPCASTGLLKPLK